MSQHTIGLIGRKVGMTQIFQPDGTMVAVSVVQVPPTPLPGSAPPTATATPPSSSARASAAS